MDQLTQNSLDRPFLFVSQIPNSKHANGGCKSLVHSYVKRAQARSYAKFPGRQTAATSRERKAPQSGRPQASEESASQKDPSSQDLGAEASPDAKSLIHPSFTPDTPRVLLASGPMTGFEARCLDFFRHKTIVDGAGWADIPFWYLALRLAPSQPSIFHALVSLSCAHESLSLTDKDQKKRVKAASWRNSNQAVRLAREYHSDRSMPMLLVLSVIFASTQMFEDVHVAHLHLTSGLKLIQEAERRLNAWSAGEREVILLVRELFDRYHSRLMLVSGARTGFDELHLAAEEPPPCIVEEFQSLFQARSCLEQICSWAVNRPKDPRSSTYIKQQTKLLNKRWLHALDRFSARSELGSGSWRILNLLRASQIISSILIATIDATTEIVLDKYILDFRRVVELHQVNCAALGTKDRYHIGLDSGMVDLLGFTAVACRDPLVRRQAIKLLLKSDRTEGSLTARTAAMVGKASLDIEEQDQDLPLECLSTRHIFESRRVRIYDLKFFLKAGVARIRFIRSPYTPWPGAEILERWYSMTDSSEEPGFLDRSEIANLHHDNPKEAISAHASSPLLPSFGPPFAGDGNSTPSITPPSKVFFPIPRV